MAKTTGKTSTLGVPLLAHPSYLKVLYYGKQGTGKSTAAAQASRLGRVFVIDAEGGLIPDTLAAHGADVNNLVVWPGDGSRITADGLAQVHATLVADLAQDPNSWAAVVFDSMTEVHHLLRENATADRVAKSRVVVDPDYVDRDDYNKMTTQLRRLVRLFRDLPCHVLFTALERQEDTGEIRPSMSPALGNDLMGYVDEVVRTAMVRGQVIGRFQPTEQINAKDRVGKFPPLMANPGFDRVVRVFTDDLDLNSDEEQTAFLESITPNQSKED